MIGNNISFDRPEGANADMQRDLGPFDSLCGKLCQQLWGEV
jgi:hypothetical protein